VSPTTKKTCSFDCIYCECGWTLENNIDPRYFYSVEEITTAIETKLRQCKENQTPVDSITFSGNGEPTLHPNFCQIIENLIILRNKYYPGTAITCLSNATQLANKYLFSVLQKIENPVLKLDAVTEPLFQLINKPIVDISVNEIIKQLQKLNGNFILQSLFLKGEIDKQAFNNAEEPHLSLWIHTVKQINPRQVMLYSLDRGTPAQGLEKITAEELQKIAVKLQQFGIAAKVY
jgi:wyosine [tRNA(Phe)-imidazoG37] synthetase (radical SAM superfamily)